MAALKIDMSKAYDRIEWSFVRQMMLSLGFEDAWVNLIMMFVSSVRYMIVHDGYKIGSITPERGLRQGDPLSPYLFILCAEGLFSILNDYASKGLIHGCKVTRIAPIISHLFFADDCFFFFKANMLECANIRDCLKAYERASG